MNRSPASLLSLCLVLLVAGCAAGRGPSGPVVSPTGIVYEPGIPPVETRYSQTASLYLRSGEIRRAAEFAEEGIEADSLNPIHYFLGGVANARLGRYVRANSLFDEAERLYPAYELDIEPERLAAWADAYNSGVEAYGLGDAEGAREAWRGAARIYDLRPEAHRNLAMLLTEEGRYEEAADVYQRALAGLERVPATRVLEDDELRAREEARDRTEESLAELLLVVERFEEAEPLLRRQLERDPENTQVRQNLATVLSGQGRREEAAEIYEDLLSEAGLEATQLFNLGVALFRVSDFQRAAEAFGRLTELRPTSRDAWFNYANSLFAAEDWEALVAAGQRLLEVDPLNEDAALIVARAHLEIGDEEGALRGLERIDAAPAHVEGLVMQPSPVGTSVHGRLVGKNAEAGRPLRLRFTFYRENELMGAETVTIPVPTTGESEPFEVSYRGRATGFRYELVGATR